MTRERAQEAVDEIVRGAGAGAESLRERVMDALEERRPATQDDIKALRKDLREISRRLEAIEQRLPAKRAPAKRTPAKRASTRAKPKKAS